MAFAADDATHSALVEFARELYLPEEDIVMGGVDAAVDKLSNMQTPEYLFVDLADSTSPLEEMGKLSGVCDPGTQVVAMGSINDISLFRDMLSAGIADYLLKPVTSDRLKQAYEAAHVKPASDTAAGVANVQADIIVVMGSRGGVGSSMIATNLAWLLGHEMDKKTALIDLDPYYGNAPMILNMEPGRGLSEALEAPERIDAVFIERTMLKEHDNLMILGAEESMQNEVALDPANIETLLEKIRENFAVVVVDTPRGNMPVIKSAMGMATHIVLVSDFSVSGMRDVIRLAGLANSIAAGTRQFVIVNHGGGGKSDVSARDFAATTALEVSCEIVSDSKSVNAALNAGAALPMAASRSAVVKALRAFCATLYEPPDDGESGKKGSFLGGIFKKKDS
jgi:pilus assembly protein CpaE